MTLKQTKQRKRNTAATDIVRSGDKHFVRVVDFTNLNMNPKLEAAIRHHLLSAAVQEVYVVSTPTISDDSIKTNLSCKLTHMFYKEEDKCIYGNLIPDGPKGFLIARFLEEKARVEIEICGHLTPMKFGRHSKPVLETFRYFKIYERDQYAYCY